MMIALDKFKNSHSEIGGAREFLSLIGKASPRATAEHYGTLHSIRVTTTIHYQPEDGAKNYHENSSFDQALAEVVRENFAELSEQALKRMAAKRAGLAFRAFDDLRALEQQLKDAMKAIDEESNVKVFHSIAATQTEGAR